MNLTVKFATEPAAVTLEVQRLSVLGQRIEIHYMVGQMPTRHSESVGNIERLHLDACGRKGSMKLAREKENEFPAVQTLTMTNESVVLDEVLGQATMQHRGEVSQLEGLEIA